MNYMHTLLSCRIKEYETEVAVVAILKNIRNKKTYLLKFNTYI